MEFFFMERMGLVGTEEIMNIILQLSDFKPLITTFYVQSASLFT